MRNETTDMLTTGLLTCGALGGFGFLAAAFLESVTRANYDWLHQPVSLLSVGDAGWTQVSNFIVTGLLMVACAIGLRRTVSAGYATKWGSILIGTYGLGLIGAGVFSADPSFGYPPGAPLGPAKESSLSDKLHGLASVIVFASLTAACFVFARHFAARPSGRTWATYSRITGFVVPVFIAAALVAWSSGNAVNFGGVFQRIAIGAGWVWIALLAVSIIREQRLSSRPLN